MQNCKCVDRSCRKITHVIFDLDGTLVSVHITKIEIAYEF